MTTTQFARETDRKDRLLTLLEHHEKVVKFKPEDKVLKYGFYDRIYNGIVEVTYTGKSSLRIKRENGRPLGVLMVTPEIANLSKKEDHLLVMLGHRLGQWHLLQIRMIGSSIKDGSGDMQMHLSVSALNATSEWKSHEDI